MREDHDIASTGDIPKRHNAVPEFICGIHDPSKVFFVPEPYVIFKGSFHIGGCEKKRETEKEKSIVMRMFLAYRNVLLFARVCRHPGQRGILMGICDTSDAIRPLAIGNQGKAERTMSPKGRRLQLPMRKSIRRMALGQTLIVNGANMKRRMMNG